MQIRLIGPYLAFRSWEDDNIKFKRIDKDHDKPNNLHQMSLSTIFSGKNDNKLVNFFPIPKSAFQQVDYSKLDGEIKLFQNLFQVIVRNKSIIFDMKETGPEEVNFIDDFNQLIEPKTFVNTGAVNSLV